MNIQNAAGLWLPELARVALDPAQAIAPLDLKGWWDVEPFEVQSRGIPWLYATPRSLLGDVTGLGKTIHMIGLVATLHMTGELVGRKAIIVVEPGAVGQLATEFQTKAPRIRTVAVTAGMDRAKRRALYRRPWDVLVVGYATMWRDAPLLTALQPRLVFFDESTAFANPDTKTAAGARTLATVAARVHAATATPFQMGLGDAFSQLQVLGLAGVRGTLFGNLWEFQQRYLIASHHSVSKGPATVASKTTWSANPATLDEFKTKVAPFYLRRNEGTADMPAVMPPEDIWLDMVPAQKARYDLIRSGVEATGSRFMSQMQAATTLANLGGPDESAKFDWFMDALDRRFVDDDGQPEKVVVFLANVAAVEALRQRLAAKGWGAALMTGEHRDIRETERLRFWEDPTCRVAIGTRAIEKSLNLQVARWAVMLDLLFNPARMEQFLGRVKRTNSRFSHVHLLRVMCKGTSEEGILRTVRERQGLADYLHGDVSDIFQSLQANDPAAAQAILNFGA